VKVEKYVVDYIPVFAAGYAVFILIVKFKSVLSLFTSFRRYFQHADSDQNKLTGTLLSGCRYFQHADSDQHCSKNTYTD
jgi:hypothetical protein